MANFFIGDIQGCYRGLKNVLKKAQFNPSTDKLWAVGDLVARGPNSLQTLLFLRDLGSSFESVLGNHDLHLIAIAHNLAQAKSNDKLTKLIKHKEFNSLIDWLKEKPLALVVNDNILVAHAGLHPLWSIEDALRFSHTIKKELHSSNCVAFLKSMYGNEPSIWNDSLREVDKNRFAVNALTRMRFLTNSGELDFTAKSHPSQADPALLPWYSVNNPNLEKSQRVIFGHWASLQGLLDNSQFIGLDTGYVWGNQMTVYHLEQNQFISYS